MKRNLVLVVVLVAFAVVATGCVAGPWTFREFVDDWAADVYADNTYSGTLVYAIVWPLGTSLGMFCDIVFLNPVAWWGSDVWDGTGTTDEHRVAPKGRTNSADNAIMEQPKL